VMKEEKLHLERCRKIIEENIQKYEEEIQKSGQELKNLFYEIQEGNVELYNQVSISQSTEEHMKQQLERNVRAYPKPYFGRLDYHNYEEEKDESIYLGKRGIVENKTKVVVVDWRTPIASVYYDNGKGDCTFTLPDNTERKIALRLKRSYDIEDGNLLGFFDSDSAVSDELLVKYLSQNKEVVLHDIIATIQQEQNAVIRTTPFENIVLQGVAGSGKTSVAIHRISHILYNYSDRFRPSDFCIVGGSEKLVNYIASGLPELDVYNVKIMKMDELFPYLLGKQWKKKYKCCNLKESQEYKSKLDFVKELDSYLIGIIRERLCLDTVIDKKIGRLLRKENNLQLIHDLEDKSYNQILEILDDRLRLKIISRTEGNIDLKQEKVVEYKNYYQKNKYVGNLLDIYIQYLNKYGEENGINVSDTVEAILQNRLDVYDTVALMLIYGRIAKWEDIEEFEQIFIDEAQDFGASVYYVLRMVMPKCYFNIMGDVSQNINFNSGMNDWNDIMESVFAKENAFFSLSKSYRNTIEISDFAGKVLECIGGGKYKIDPVIRHGEKVEIIDTISPQEAIAEVENCILKAQETGSKTIAAICFTEDERDFVGKKLSKRAVGEIEKQGVSILTVEETKGVEFDTVIVWKPNLTEYDIQYGKKLYVAVTRALHKLYLIK